MRQMLRRSGKSIRPQVRRSSAIASEQLSLLERLREAEGRGDLEEFNRFLDWLQDGGLRRELARVRDRQNNMCRLPEGQRPRSRQAAEN